jgi:hypothetical protein
MILSELRALTSVVQFGVLQLLHAAVQVDVAVDEQYNFVFQKFVCVHESVLVAQPFTAHVLHDLVSAPEAPEIVRFLRYEVDMTDKGIADVEKETGLDLLLARRAAIFIKLRNRTVKRMLSQRIRDNTTVHSTHLSDYVDLMRVQQRCTGALQLHEGVDAPLCKV